MGIPLFFFKSLDQKRTKKHRLGAESVLCILPVAYLPLVYQQVCQNMERAFFARCFFHPVRLQKTPSEYAC